MPVANIRTQSCEVYVGRKANERFHFGNPYTFLKNSNGLIVVPSREIAVENFEKWLMGEIDTDREQERLLWILENLKTLKGKTLGCWCAPAPCHATVLERLANEWAS